MPAMSDIDELMKKQAEATAYALSMVDEKDPQKILEMAAEMQKKGAALEKMALAIEAAMLGDTAGGATGEETTVALTPEQRARITEQTGVGMEVVTLRDSRDRAWSKEMPKANPEEIEKEAARQAIETMMIIETRKEVEKIIKELEAANVPELKEKIEELKRDPTLGRGKKKK
jgi:hypothetical protein